MRGKFIFLNLLSSSPIIIQSGVCDRWKGGKITKLEGSDHAPVYMTLKEIPDIPLHSTPSLSARYIAEIRGSQQTIVSVLMKRQMADQLNCTLTSSSSVGECTDRSHLSESMKRTMDKSCVSSIRSEELYTSVIDAKEIDLNSFNGSKLVGRHGHNLDSPKADSGKRKKTKQNQLCQRSLRSFFQTVSTCNNGSNSANDVSCNEGNIIAESKDDQKEVPDCNDKSYSRLETSHLSLSIGTQEKQLDPCCSENEKKKDAVLEWRRIQQMMQESIPLCDGHREPCVARVVKKPGLNFGRRFYVCARSQGPASNPETRCDFFRWACSKSKHK